MCVIVFTEVSSTELEGGHIVTAVAFLNTVLKRRHVCECACQYCFFKVFIVSFMYWVSLFHGFGSFI